MKLGIVPSLFVFCLVLSACGAGGGRRAVTVVAAVAPDTAVVETPQPVAEVFSVALTGDIMMGTTYPDTLLPAGDGRALFVDVRDILASADLAVGNLEGTLCDSAATRKRKSEHSYSFRTPVRFAARLKEAGYDYLSLANNHTFDFGYDGMLSTEKALDGQGISYSGIRHRRQLCLNAAE